MYSDTHTQLEGLFDLRDKIAKKGVEYICMLLADRWYTNYLHTKKSAAHFFWTKKINLSNLQVGSKIIIFDMLF